MASLELCVSETPATTPNKKKRAYHVHKPRRIKLPNGDTLWPRVEFCRKIDITDRTARNLKLPSVLIGGIAYVPHDASLNVIASRIRHAPELRETKRGRRR
jgi:hypothetical protein